MAKILLIEDEPDQIKMVKIRLEASGYQVISTEKAKDGIKLAQEKKPDLILMDMILPDIHGLDATIILKKLPETKEIPVIALTAMNPPGFEEACFKEGICDFIQKPYDHRELCEKIKRNIGK